MTAKRPAPLRPVQIHRWRPYSNLANECWVDRDAHGAVTWSASAGELANELLKARALIDAAHQALHGGTAPSQDGAPRTP